MEGLWGFYCDLFQHIIERIIKAYQLCNMDETGFFQKQKYCKVVVSKGSRKVLSNSAKDNFHVTFDICISAAEIVDLSLLIVPGKQLNWGVLEGCDIEVAHVTTSSKMFYPLYFILDLGCFLFWICT